MARYTGPVCRLCRREGKKLFLKGDRCYTNKCAIMRRDYFPGQHGQGRKKVSEYGIQLRAKQMTKRYYGVLENQFRHYYDMSTQMSGKTGENLLILLESRLDNVIYRLGWASSRAQARQFVMHGHFEVNGVKTDIPSFLVKAGDIITVRERSRKNDKLKAILDANADRSLVKWLQREESGFEAKVLNRATREDVDLEVEETLIVELYSK